MTANEQEVLDLYARREITLQRAAEILSVDLWSMIEKVKKADIHLDYTLSELQEDLPISDQPGISKSLDSKVTTKEEDNGA